MYACIWSALTISFILKPLAAMLNPLIEPVMVYIVEMGSTKKFATDTMNKALTSAVSIPDMSTAGCFAHTSPTIIFLQMVEATEALRSMAPRNLRSAGQRHVRK